MEKFKKKK